MENEKETKKCLWNVGSEYCRSNDCLFPSLLRHAKYDEKICRLCMLASIVSDIHQIRYILVEEGEKI